MVKHVMPYVAGSYGAALVILGFLSVASVLRYRAARRRLAAIEPRGRGPQRRSAGCHAETVVMRRPPS